MIDVAAFKQALKDADDGQAIALFCWAKACMEVRGLIQIEGSTPGRKRRSDAGKSRTAEAWDCPPRSAQPSLSGLPDETGVGE